MGVTPDELGTGTTLTNAFAGDIEIYTSCKLNTYTCEDAFGISICGLPKEACVSLATMDWGSSHSSGLIAVQVATLGGRTLYTTLPDCSSSSSSGSARQCSKDGPMPIVAAAKVCNESAIDTHTELCMSLNFY